MKTKILFFLIAIVPFTFAQSQSHSKITIFNDEGNAFTLTLNGKTINESPQNRIDADELTQSQYSVLINFENKSLGIVKKNVFLEHGNHYVFRSFANKRGKQVLRLFSNSPITDLVDERAPKSTRRDQVPHEEKEMKTTPKPVKEQPAARDAETPSRSKEGQHTEVTMTMPDGSRFEMSVKTNDESTRQEEMQMPDNNPNTQAAEEVEMPQEDIEEEPVIYVEGYTGRIGCPHPISQKEVSNIINTIENQTFSDTKMRTAKRALNNKCINVEDIGKIMNLFTFEDAKIEFAKYAYGFTHDVDNYYMLYNNFTFEATIEELEEYIER